jgi:hypothetical protein
LLEIEQGVMRDKGVMRDEVLSTKFVNKVGHPPTLHLSKKMVKKNFEIV